jgi:hypothetical protein
MRRKVADRWYWIWSAPVGLAFVALVAFGAGASEQRELDIINDSPGVVEATVLSVDTEYRRRDGYSYRALVELEHESGLKMTVYLPSTRDKTYYKVGDVVPVRYATDGPVFNYDVRHPPEPDRTRFVAWTCLWLALGSLVVATVLALVSRWRGRWKG